MFTLTLSTGPIVLIMLSMVLFVFACWFCHWQGIFDNFNDSFGLGPLFAVVVFCIVWLVPTLAAWAVWATWLR